MADFRPLEAELARYFEQHGVHVVEARGDRYIAVGRVTRVDGHRREDGRASSQPTVRIHPDDRGATHILCIADLADHLANVWGGAK